MPPDNLGMASGGSWSKLSHFVGGGNGVGGGTTGDSRGESGVDNHPLHSKPNPKFKDMDKNI
jgi:hypothetical protein